MNTQKSQYQDKARYETQHKNKSTKKCKRLPKSIRKYIRVQKSLIRHQEFDSKKQAELIQALYLELGKKTVILKKI